MQAKLICDAIAAQPLSSGPLTVAAPIGAARISKPKCLFGKSEVIKLSSRSGIMIAASGANGVVNALELSSPSAGLIS
jgi:hypothetical protein